MKVEVLSVEKKNKKLTIAVVRAGSLIGEVPADAEVRIGEAEMVIRPVSKRDGRLVVPLFVQKQ